MPRVRKPAAGPISTDFSLQEKSNLLSALKRKGFHIISTPAQLMDDLPGRSEAEIAALITSYRVKKPPVRCVSNHQVAHHPADDGTHEVMAIEGTPAASPPDSESSPIESWFRLVHSHMNFRDKRDDLSSTLSESLTCLSPPDDLSNVYAYISDCMEGRYPRQLTLKESVIVVQLLEDLKSAADECGGQLGEWEYLRSGSWWSAQNGSHDHDEDDDGSGGETQTSSSQSCDGLTGEETSSLPSVLQQFLTSCLKFPKVKRIGASLNPLQVPVRMLELQQQRLFKQNLTPSTTSGTAVCSEEQDL